MYTTLTVKTSSDIRSAAKALAEELGISLTTVVNALLKQFIKERKFSVSASPMPTERKIAVWERISREMDEGGDSSGPFADNEKLFNHLKI